MDEWIRHFKDVWSTKREEGPSVSATTDENVYPATAEELTDAITYSMSKKAPGNDEINTELMKHAPTALYYRFLDLLNICWRTGYIPEK
jgi:hypothetical protein